MIIAFHQSTIIRRQSKPFQKLTKSSKSNNAEAKVLIYMSCKHIYFHFIRPVDDPASFHSLVSFILRWLWFILIILAPRPLLDLFLIWRSLRSLSAWAFFRFGFFWQSVEFVVVVVVAVVVVDLVPSPLRVAWLSPENRTQKKKRRMKDASLRWRVILFPGRISSDSSDTFWWPHENLVVYTLSICLIYQKIKINP